LAAIGPHSDPRFLHLKLPARIKNLDGALKTLSIRKLEKMERDPQGFAPANKMQKTLTGQTFSLVD